MANSWGLLYEHNDVGPAGARLLALGAAAIPALTPLLRDDRESVIYMGSEEATVGNAYHFRVKDFAAFYLGKITRIPAAYHAGPVGRDREIASLENALRDREAR